MEHKTQLDETIEGMLSADYKERFKAEYLQAVIRRDKLEAMLVMYADGTLPFKPNSSIALLKAQTNVLGAYVNILKLRAEQEQIEL
jgi:hypothetical protein